MRINGERPDSIANNQPAAEKGRTTRADASASPGAARADRVEVSADARLFSEAVAAAKSAPTTPSDLAVERARQKMVSGELGRDAERLADKLIDHLLR